MRFFRIAAIALPLLGSVLPSHGAILTYSTLSRFNGGAFSSSATITVGGASLTFNGLGTTSVDFGLLTFGTFNANAIGSGGTIPPGTTFDLQLNQTTPSAGSAVAAATLSGTITPTSSSVALVFNTTAFSIGGVNYTISQPPGGIPIVSPASNSGLTTLQGSAAAAQAVPEPATYFSLGAGVLIIGLLCKRRQRAVKV
jgi:hypothetical protein